MPHEKSDILKGINQHTPVASLEITTFLIHYGFGNKLMYWANRHLAYLK